MEDKNASPYGKKGGKSVTVMQACTCACARVCVCKSRDEMVGRRDSGERGNNQLTEILHSTLKRVDSQALVHDGRNVGGRGFIGIFAL